MTQEMKVRVVGGQGVIRKRIRTVKIHTQGKWWRTMFKASLNGIMTTMKKADSVKISGVTCGVYQRGRLGMQNQQQMCLRQEGGICGESPAAYRISQQARMSWIKIIKGDWAFFRARRWKCIQRVLLWAKRIKRHLAVHRLTIFLNSQTKEKSW